MMSSSDALIVFVPSLTGISLVRLGRHLVENGNRVDRRRLVTDQAGQRRTLRPVAFAGRAEAAEQVDLERRRLVELCLAGSLIARW